MLANGDEQFQENDVDIKVWITRFSSDSSESALVQSIIVISINLGDLAGDAPKWIRGIPVKKAPPFAGRYLIGGAFLYSIFGPPKIDQIRPTIDLFSAAGEKFWRLRRANAPETRFLHDFPFVEHQKPQNFSPAAG